MGGGYFGEAGRFLIDTVFTFYMLTVLLRFLFQLHRADFYNPISQFIVKITDPPLKILRRFVPGLFGLDISAIILLLLLAMAKLYLLIFINGLSPRFPGVFVLAVAETLEFIIYFYIFAILIRVLMSWFASSHYHPAMRLLATVTEPVMRPARNLLPAMGGLDFSPIVVLILLNLALTLIVLPISDLGRSLL